MVLMENNSMKKKILAAILGLTLCLGMTGCAGSGYKGYDTHSKLIAVEGEKDLYYYSTTHIVYIAFSEAAGYGAYGYMAPYYSKNGKLCIYDTEKKQINEISE